jgi:hypothetical protein
MMQDIATFFEDGIRKHPHDWLMLQKVFVADLDPARQARAARAAQNGSGPPGTGVNGSGPRGDGQIAGEDTP